jgi:hypothetical protein
MLDFSHVCVEAFRDPMDPQSTTKAVQDRVDVLLVVDTGPCDQAYSIIDESAWLLLLRHSCKDLVTGS